MADYIVKTPGICSGQPDIAGTRIKVKHIYTWVERMGISPAQVVAEYPHLTMAQVHAALAYYWSHRDEIDQDIENEEILVADLRAKAGPSKIQQRLAEQDAANGGSNMVARGRVQNGVVVLPDGVHLPEGEEVTVLALPTIESKVHSILDITPVSLGAVVGSFTADDDLLGEMLEGRS